MNLWLHPSFFAVFFSRTRYFLVRLLALFLSRAGWANLAALVCLAPPAHALSPKLVPSFDVDSAQHTLPGAQTSTSQKLGRLVNIRVVDRTSGASLPIYEHQGEYWVVGSAGHNYAVSMQRRTSSGRILAVTSVDGINVISGQTAAYLQTGYVLSGYEPYQITGWRKSLREVAAFTFAEPGESYASKTGRAANIGVIGVAVFVEQKERNFGRPELEKSEESRDPAQARSGAAMPAPKALSEAADSSASAGPAPQVPGAQNRQDSANESKKSADMSARAQSSISPGLGTQHGQREVSVTQNVAFRRGSNTPDEIVMIRYDSAQNLVRRGVLAYAETWQGSLPTARPFPRSLGFVADPPR